MTIPIDRFVELNWLIIMFVRANHLMPSFPEKKRVMKVKCLDRYKYLE